MLTFYLLPIYCFTMPSPALVFFAVAVLARGAISHQGRGGTCGPFQLTTTSGTLYSAPNGTQLPGSTDTELEPGAYLISDDGTLTTYDGFLCEFRRVYFPQQEAFIG